MQEKMGTIYALSHPVTGDVRYIGQTTQRLEDRLAGHLNHPSNPAMRLWISTLTGAGLIPDITAVASGVRKTDLDREEEQQIDLHAGRGCRLLNHPHYLKNLGAVYTEDSDYDRETADDSDIPRLGPRMFLRQVDLEMRSSYRALARRRAEGELSGPRGLWEAIRETWWMACHVLRGDRLWRVTKRLGVAVGAGAYLHYIDADRVLRKQVAPRVPKDDIAKAWAQYASEPFSLAVTHGAAAYGAAYLAAICAGTCAYFGELNRQPKAISEEGLIVNALKTHGPHMGTPWLSKVTLIPEPRVERTMERLADAGRARKQIGVWTLADGTSAASTLTPKGPGGAA